MHPLMTPREPHFVHLSWAVRRLSIGAGQVHQAVLRRRGAARAGRDDLGRLGPPTRSRSSQAMRGIRPAS